MATKGKETPSSKEERVTCSAQPRKTVGALQQSKSPNTSKQVSPVKRHDSTASEKHIPNYLKPTICSGLDLKKNATSDMSKSRVTRRKSFDRPLLPSPIQKTPSPKERSFRSSSFTTRSATPHKSLPTDRLLKPSKDVGKGQPSCGRPVSAKKSSTNIKKDENENQSSAAKEQKASNTTDGSSNIHDVTVVELAPHQEDSDASITQVDEQVLNPVNKTEMATQVLVHQEDLDIASITQVDEQQILNPLNNNETAIEVLVKEDDRHINLPEQYEARSPEVVEVEMVESSMDGSDEAIAFQIEKPEEIMNVEERINRDNDEIIESKEDVQDEEDGEAKPKENAGGQEMDKEEEGNYEGSLTEDVQLQETENAEDHAKEIKDDVDNEDTNQQVIQGKKESSVSNDVIEETATRLREQRKNKVKALAGAFETVISLQEPK